MQSSNYGNIYREFPESEVNNIHTPAEHNFVDPNGFKNAETTLLEHLFTSYNPNARPVKDYNRPVQVNFTVTLARIVDMNTKSQELKTCLWLNFQWTDEFLTWKPENYQGVKTIRVPIDQIWKPDILLYNSVSENFDPSFPTKAVIQSTGAVNWLPPALVTSSCKVNVRYYPFDHQECLFMFGPWSHNIEMLNVTLIGDSADLSIFEDSNTWELMSMKGKRIAQAFEATPNDPPFVMIEFNLKIKRWQKYGLMNFVYPCLIVLGMAICTFILPGDSGEKIGLSMTVLLGLVVFMQILSAETPPTSDKDETPIIASFFLTSMWTVCGSTVATVLQLCFHHRDVNLQRKFLPDPFRYLFLKFLPKYLWIKPFEAESVADLKWFNLTNEPSNVNEKVSQVEHIYQNLRSKISPTALLIRDSSQTTGQTLPSELDKNFYIDTSPLPTISNNLSTNMPTTKSDYSQNTTVATQIMSENSCELLKILQEIRKITDHLAEEAVKNDGIDEWKYCAIVFDRFCFCVFSLNCLFCFCITLGTAPGFIFGDGSHA